MKLEKLMLLLERSDSRFWNLENNVKVKNVQNEGEFKKRIAELVNEAKKETKYRHEFGRYETINLMIDEAKNDFPQFQYALFGSKTINLREKWFAKWFGV
jgi:hypothetical protein